MQILTNVKIYTPERTFREGTIVIEAGRIRAVSCGEAPVRTEAGAERIDGGGAYAIPGLVDMHFHGCMGDDICDGTKEALATLAAYEASVGVAAMAPATMTLPKEELLRVLSVAAAYKEEEDGTKGAVLVGINMEGPFISPVKRGAQDESNILGCDVPLARAFFEASGGLVKCIGIAPEENGDCADFIRAMRELGVHVSLAHTNADYESAAQAIAAGADHVVHLFNAMPPFHHRDPGVVGAAFDAEHVTAELICDGVHIHPAMVRAAFALFGEERIIFISDSMRATGLADGKYTLGGLPVIVEGNHARMERDGALAGSVTNLMDCLRTAVRSMGIPLENAVACATINPARKLGIDDRFGSIVPGKYAKLLLLDEDLAIRQRIGF